ncbi:MAG: PP2C family protein-serine/threonine phosphatase [Bradymonadia bacterium]
MNASASVPTDNDFTKTLDDAFSRHTDAGMPATLAPVSFARPAAFGQPVEGAALTDTGCVRARNEDSYLLRPDVGLFAVADGMGGHAAGHVASALCVEALSMAVSGPIDEDPRLLLPRAIEAANTRIRARAEAQIHLSGMGTTVAALWLHEGWAVIAHVGDSRVYRIRGGRLDPLTLDHSLVGAAIRHGQLTREEAEMLGPCNVLTQALGTRDTVSVEVAEVPVQPGDRFLICSDGISDLISDDDIARTLDAYDTPAGAVRSLALQAMDAGGKDNLTAVVVDAR